MMGTWNTMTPRQKEAAAEIFDALSTLDTLCDRHAETAEGTRKVGFSDLYAFATGDRMMDADLRRALENDPRLGEDLSHLLDKVSLCHFLRVAAASSSSSVENREEGGFKIRLRQSQAADSQTYVIIELADEQATPKALFLCGPKPRYDKVELPEPQDGIIQLLAESDSDLVQGLRDRQMEVFLK